MTVTVITSYEQFKEVIAGEEPVVIDFWAPWCGPCRAISPVLDKISDETAGVHFYKLNIDEIPNAAEEASIRSIPAFMLYKNGNKVDSVIGGNPSALQVFVNKASESK